MMVLGMIVFIGVLGYLTYFMSKKIKKIQNKKFSENGNMMVIDTIAIEMNQTIRLLKVGDRNILYSSGIKGTTMIDMGKDEIKKVFKKDQFQEMMQGESVQKGLKNVSQGLLKKLEGMKKK